jgi:hypothetical protein
MIRNLKTLGILLVAIFAMSAVAASAASAAIEFHSEGEATTFTGKQDGGATFDNLTADGGSTLCELVSYTGTLSKSTSTTLELTPIYSNCTAFGNKPAHVLMNGCTYLLHWEGALMEIKCAGTNEMTIEITASKTNTTVICNIHIPPQSLAGSIAYSNIGATTTREITLEFNINSIKYSQTAGTGPFACATKDGTTNGTLAAKALLTGEHTLGGVTTHTGIWVA